MTAAPSPTTPFLPPDREIHVMSLTAARRHKRRYDAVLSLHDPGLHRNRQLTFNRRPMPPHLTLFFDDIDETELERNGWRAPTRAHAEQALAFFRANPGRVLVHCHAGVSRSGAMAFLGIADRLGPGLEREALQELLRVRDCAVPNERLVGFADEVLGRGGRMVEAFQAHLSQDPAWQWRRRAQREVFAMTTPSDHVRHMRR